MIFSSIEFIFIFCPLFLLIYYLLPDKFKNIALFTGSILFYAIGSLQYPESIYFLLISITANYFLGKAISKYNTVFWFVLGLASNLIYQGCFKYYFDVLPLGISFYTFQAVAYLCDIRRRKYSAEHNYIYFATYLSMFPYLISGPLVRYDSMHGQIQNRCHSMKHFVDGIQTFIIGLGYKVLLADQIAYLWRQLGSIGYESISTPLAWLGLFGYCFLIYFDFLGYSLMAIGLGKILGFELPANFDQPYLALSMTDFWRRWHMTLGSWFRDYVYIPLGGNRKGTLRTAFHLFVVWMLTSIWHGTSFNFILWGMLICCLILLEKAGLKKLLHKYKVLGHLYMLIAIPLSWALFAVPNTQKLFCFLGRLFGIEQADANIFAGDFIKYGKEYGILLLICFLFITDIPRKLWSKLDNTYIGKLMLMCVFLGAVYFMYGNANNQFLYYQF